MDYPEGAAARRRRVMDRRTFLQSSIAPPSAARVFDGAVAGEAADRPAAGERKAVLISMLPKDLPYAQRFAHGARGGIRRDRDADDRARATRRRRSATRRRQAGLRIHSVMNADHWRFPLSSGDPRRRQPQRRRHGDLACATPRSGAPTPCCSSRPSSMRRRRTATRGRARSSVIRERLLPLAQRAEGRSIAVEEVWNKFLLEPGRVRPLRRRARLAVAARRISTSATSSSTATRRTGSARSGRASPRCT